MIFEGEYLDGKIWNGKGKNYDSNGCLIFEGEYKNGLKEGYIKEYHNNGKLKFQGEYLKCKKKEKQKNIILKEI